MLLVRATLKFEEGCAACFDVGLRIAFCSGKPWGRALGGAPHSSDIAVDTEVLRFV